MVLETATCSMPTHILWGSVVLSLGLQESVLRQRCQMVCQVEPAWELLGRGTDKAWVRGLVVLTPRLILTPALWVGTVFSTLILHEMFRELGCFGGSYAIAIGGVTKSGSLVYWNSMLQTFSVQTYMSQQGRTVPGHLAWSVSSIQVASSSGCWRFSWSFLDV